jgi:hypothetical protein
MVKSALYWIEAVAGIYTFGIHIHGVSFGLRLVFTGIYNSIIDNIFLEAVHDARCVNIDVPNPECRLLLTGINSTNAVPKSSVDLSYFPK